MADADQLITALGQRVRTLREYRGMVQRELGDKVGLGRTSIANLEAGRQGNVPATVLVALAEALGVKVGQLLGEVDMPSMPMVEVLTLHRIRCNQCGLVADNVPDAEHADRLRRSHLHDHNDGSTDG